MLISRQPNSAVIEAQLRTVPPYVIGALWALIASYASFRLRNRYIPMLSALIFQVIGYAIAIGTKNTHARFAHFFPYRNDGNW